MVGAIEGGDYRFVRLFDLPRSAYNSKGDYQGGEQEQNAYHNDADVKSLVLFVPKPICPHSYRR